MTRRDPVVDAAIQTTPAAPARVPSPSQREAIEAEAKPLLVLAGPGAGKTFCLIERIRFLLEHLGTDPARICAFTFTNKAAGEIAERLARTLGDRAALVKTGTIHSFCTELLREFGSRIGVARGFGIADEIYQKSVLRRLRYNPQYAGSLLQRFSAHRFRGEPFRHPRDEEMFARYQRFLGERRVLDFDMLVVRAAELLADHGIAQQVRARWDCVLVDEFQDLNPFQYQVIREIGREHGNIFAVGDEEQSIYGWAGADPRVFVQFLNDFELTTTVSLRENRRCPREILTRARRLVESNPPMFAERKSLESDRDEPGCVSAFTFAGEDAELAWVIDDLRRRHRAGTPWGETALLYRMHRIGDAAEAALLTAGIPCRLAQGRALGEDPIVAYAIAALRVLSCDDDVYEDAFLETMLPETFVHAVRARADEAGSGFRAQLQRAEREMPRDHADAKKIRRAFAVLHNLGALRSRHATLEGLVEELLAQRVGAWRTPLEERQDELSDPASHGEVVALADRLVAAREGRRPVSLALANGAGIALKGMLLAAGFPRVSIDGVAPAGAERLEAADAPRLGLPLALFKALQLVHCAGFRNVFRDFTAVDIETTDNCVESAETVEIAAVRVRDGIVVDEISALVRPRGRIAPAARRVHGISDEDVAGAPSFEEVWPRFREFCGRDVLVAHSGFHFDFPILKRQSGDATLNGYDTLPLARDLHPTSAKLGDLARHYGFDPGRSHRALDDTRTLARVCLALHDDKVVVARKTALLHLLDHLGVALVLDAGERDPEAAVMRDICRIFALGRYSDSLAYYERERDLAGDPSLPTVEQVVEWLGGETLRQKLLLDRTADERYPAAMARLRRLIALCPGESLGDQITLFLERVALSRADGADPARERVNLLTLHSTKGLEFAHVYILGVEDAQLPGDTDRRSASRPEVEEARRLLYVGMTRAKQRLVMTRVEARDGRPTGGHRFLDEMGIVPGEGARMAEDGN